jgi:8-oxo-dGTP diphosphatase
MTGPLHSVSVAGVTFDDEGRVLLIRRRDNGQWQAPGGVLELDEAFEQGVVREVLEETGVEVTVEKLTGVYKNLRRGIVALVYRCTPVSGSPRETVESAETRWFDVDEAKEIMPHTFSIRVLDAANAGVTTAASRAHDGVEIVGG